MRFKPTALALSAAGALFAAMPASAQLSIYGTLDAAVDRVDRKEGDVSGTVFGNGPGGIQLPNSTAAAQTTRNRVSPSLTSPSKLGFRGVEPLGGGYAGRFQLEMSLVPDTGTLGGDGRVFGRMAWVGLTTPLGEVRLGRQASPMLAAFDLTTTERLGSTDVMGAGVVLNSLQTYQDNAVSFGLKTGPWLAILQASPNAGVGESISLARNGSGFPAAVGQIVGGLTSSGETNTGRGKTFGGMVSFSSDDLSIATAVHHNDFGVPVLLLSPALGAVPIFQRLEEFTGVMIGGKYRFRSTDTTVGANLHTGKFEESGTNDPETRTVAFGIGQRVANFNVLLQASQTEFTNFTRGKDTALMLGADYDFSKRTSAYLRAGSVKDTRGNVTPVGATNVAGGPLAVLGPLGISEIPVFSGAGIHIGGTTTIVGVGVRHSF